MSADELDIATADLARIVDYVRDHQGTSFVELCHRIPGAEDFRGDYEMVLGDMNIVLWQEVSHRLTKALDLGRETGVLVSTPASSLLVYLADGKLLDMPIAKQSRIYKEPHWLPVVFNVADGVEQNNAA